MLVSSLLSMQSQGIATNILFLSFHDVWHLAVWKLAEGMANKKTEQWTKNNMKYCMQM